MSGSIVGLSTWNLWRAKWQWDWFYTESFGFLPVTKITQVLCTHSCAYHNDGVVKYHLQNRTRLGTFNSIIRLALKKFSLSLSLSSCDNELQRGIKFCPDSNTEKSRAKGSYVYCICKHYCCSAALHIALNRATHYFLRRWRQFSAMLLYTDAVHTCRRTNVGRMIIVVGCSNQAWITEDSKLL